MGLIRMDIRQQIAFAPLDSMVAHDSVARVIDALIDQVKFKKLGFVMKGYSKVGRGAYYVGDLLKLYVYGYLNEIRSSHKLAAACGVNLEIRWLINGLRPCQRTVSDFRRDNSASLKKLFYWFNCVLADLGLFSDRVFAVDSAFIEGQNSKKNNFSEAKIERNKARLEKQIEEFMHGDASTDCDTAAQDAAKLKSLEDNLAKYTEMAQYLEMTGQSQVSLTDPDTRALAKSGSSVVGYNLQSSVDSEHKLIACLEVTNETDTNALHDIAVKTQEVAKQKDIVVLADKGYETGRELKKCTEDHIETYVTPKTQKKEEDVRLQKKDFHYHPDQDVYVCPEGKQLKTNGKVHTKKNKGRKPYQSKDYKASFSDCQNCPLRDCCLTANSVKGRRGRRIERTEFDDFIEANRERTTENRELLKQRQAIVEHPFGTIKRGWGYNYTLLKTKELVQGEYSLIGLVYNLRRAMSIFEIPGILELFKAQLHHFIQFFQLTALYLHLVRITKSHIRSIQAVHQHIAK